MSRPIDPSSVAAAVTGLFVLASDTATRATEWVVAIEAGIAEQSIAAALDLQSPTPGVKALNHTRSDAMQRRSVERMKGLPPETDTVMLRSTFEDDGRLPDGIGAVLKFVAGWSLLLVVTSI